MPFENPSCFVIDQNFAVILDAEKVLLFEELLKHFGPKWREEVAAGQEVSGVKKVAAMCKTLKIEAEVIPTIANLQVLGDAPTEAPKPKAASKAPAAPAEEPKSKAASKPAAAAPAAAPAEPEPELEEDEDMENPMLRR